MTDQSFSHCDERTEQEREDGSAIRLAFFTFGLIAGFMIGWAWGIG